MKDDQHDNDENEAEQALREIESKEIRISRRDKKLIKLFFSGLPASQIPARLGISRATVNRTIARLDLRRIKRERVDKRSIYRIARAVNKAKDDAEARAAGEKALERDEEGAFHTVEIWQNGQPWVGPFGIVPDTNSSVREVRDPLTGALSLRCYVTASSQARPATGGTLLDGVEPLSPLAPPGDEDDQDES